MLCSTDITNSTSPRAPQSVHVDTPTPGTYQATHPFFIWQQSNFLESKALEHYTNWSKGAHERRLTAQNGSEIDETRLFVIEYLGWTDFDCGADQQRCGCPLDSNVLNEIIVAIPDDAIKARQVYFSMKMLHWANQLVCTVLIAGNSAELAMLSKSGEFAEICMYPSASLGRTLTNEAQSLSQARSRRGSRVCQTECRCQRARRSGNCPGHCYRIRSRWPPSRGRINPYGS